MIKSFLYFIEFNPPLGNNWFLWANVCKTNDILTSLSWTLDLKLFLQTCDCKMWPASCEIQAAHFLNLA